MYVKSYHNPKFIRSLSKSRKYLLVRERLRAIEMAMQGISIHRDKALINLLFLLALS